MRVRCISERPSEAQAGRLGASFSAEWQAYGLVLGQEYLVFGLSMSDEVVLVHVSIAANLFVAAPLFLFEISDRRIPSLWRGFASEDGMGVDLWPESFSMRSGFAEDLAEFAPYATQEFERLRRLLEIEGQITL